MRAELALAVLASAVIALAVIGVVKCEGIESRDGVKYGPEQREM